ncbi:MAG: hypothetical protein JW987_04220 [Anaerolineaceae bacterium]|nr:hypothetical protein [Anaerolineaceae bacterium]
MNDLFETEPEMVAILASDVAEIDKLSKVFKMIVEKQVEYTRGAVELARVTGDREALVKEQIKMGMLKNATEIFAYAYLRVTGKRAGNE